MVVGERWAGKGLEDLVSPHWVTHFLLLYPLCHQFLMTSHTHGMELGTACLKAGAALLASLQAEAFQNVLMISQLLPVLNHRSYVDLISPDCLAPRGSQAFCGSLVLFNLQDTHWSLHGPVRGGGLGLIYCVHRGLCRGGGVGTPWQLRCGHSF